jgi:hypothetical protein
MPGPTTTPDLAARVEYLRRQTQETVEECLRARAALAATVAKSRELQAECEAARGTLGVLMKESPTKTA